MAGDNAAVFGIFAIRASAEVAVDRLTAAGFSSRGFLGPDVRQGRI